MEQTRNKHVLRLAQAAMIAALYIVDVYKRQS